MKGVYKGLLISVPAAEQRPRTRPRAIASGSSSTRPCQNAAATRGLPFSCSLQDLGLSAPARLKNRSGLGDEGALHTLRRHAWAKVRNAGWGISIASGVGLRCTVDAAEDDPDDSESCDPSPDLGPVTAHVHGLP